MISVTVRPVDGFQRTRTACDAVPAVPCTLWLQHATPLERPQVEQHAPLYAGMMPLGNVADDGSGIELGVAVGAATDRMDRCSAWK